MPQPSSQLRKPKYWEILGWVPKPNTSDSASVMLEASDRTRGQTGWHQPRMSFETGNVIDRQHVSWVTAKVSQLLDRHFGCVTLEVAYPWTSCITHWFRAQHCCAMGTEAGTDPFCSQLRLKPWAVAWPFPTLHGMGAHTRGRELVVNV